MSDTLYVICNLTPAGGQYSTVVTAIGANGQKKWTATLPDGHTASLPVIALRSLSETMADLYQVLKRFYGGVPFDYGQCPRNY
ncbi:MAG TPA: hypothetical protein P5532_05870 [Planctomycetota bacterium]|nr:hypothetical protein [Bacillota bacterium]HQG93276.1 hypothetical protein [Acidobacteriota bacterium]HRR84444.1 hypothetical protein [Phycisphaerae bacterium]HRT93930.1 hypothetical protein [Planctomycetota bacterium]